MKTENAQLPNQRDIVMPPTVSARPVESPCGLLAIGSSGPWEVVIDQTTSGPDRWFMQIEGRLITLYFEIPGVSIVDDMIRLFGPSSTNRAVQIKMLDAPPVNLVRDNEYSDRCFVVVGDGTRPVLRFTLSGDDLTQLEDALKQIKEDLE